MTEKVSKYCKISLWLLLAHSTVYSGTSLYDHLNKATTSKLRPPPVGPNFSPLLYIHFRTKTTPEFRITTSVYGPVHVLGVIITTTSSHSELYNRTKYSTVYWKAVTALVTRLAIIEDGCHRHCDNIGACHGRLSQRL